MSAARIDEFSSINLTDDKREIFEERSRILEMVSQKAKEKTLTLQETTDLYAKFNSTFDPSFHANKRARKDDESWALKLLEESEQEAEKEALLETRINGIPLDAQAKQGKKAPKQFKPSLISNNFDSSRAHAIENPDLAIYVEEDFEEKPRLRDAFIYEQFSLKNDLKRQNPHRKTHQSLFIIMFISTLISMAAIVGTSWLV